ncbi:dUTP pyrophosphatase [Nematocida displodere]|uniref:Deoxyuridine 5'-triphosphate nucleotidohydrolase n=1 Tax=Nematocida displodere TaxID=1805483 RepID=A0A177EAK6_9MICR|nr:dUTP pyrophosphatase [Nematocida displodere]
MTATEASFKVKLLTSTAICPKIATPGSAGYDLYSDETGSILPGERKKVSLGVSFEIPEGFYGQIHSRSGLALKYGLITLGGVIDSDYRGEVSVMLFNSGGIPFGYEKGERIAQMVILRVFTEAAVVSVSVSQTARSVGGFGSTGLR